MDDRLLSYYNRELAYIRQLGAEFAETHPKIAGRLRLDGDTVEDPHVSRLIEAFAFLTARIRHKLDDDFPELTEALMGLLYPDYHAPVPSMSIAQLALQPARAETMRVPAGTALYTDSNPEGSCYYRTAYDVDVLPADLEHVEFRARPFEAPTLPEGQSQTSAQAVLRARLRARPEVTLAETAPQRLRFHIHGQPQFSNRLYEFLLNHATGIAIAEHPNDPSPIFLSADQLRPCGLDEDSAVLPRDGRSSHAHRLLMEYFCFPEKFLFVELDDIGDVWSRFGEKAELYIYFSRTHSELVQGVSTDSLLLGCTPIANLFDATLEPLDASELEHEAKLCVDASQQESADVHTLNRVYACDGEGRTLALQPFYGAHRESSEAVAPRYWHARREISHFHNGRRSRGVDTYLSLVDRAFQITAPDSDWLVRAEALCTNRDLPDRLPFGPEQPRLNFLHGGAGLQLRCTTPPTTTLQPRLDDTSRWQLVTQLTLQHFTGEDGLQTLKETLRLHDFREAPENQAIIDGLIGVTSELATARIARGGRVAICQGTRIKVDVDEARFSGAGLFLFGAVLSEFFAQHCTVNTFVQLQIKSQQRAGRVITWPPRSGNQSLI